MNPGRGAPAAALGLFLYLAAALPCSAIDGLSLSGGGGSLWVDSDKGAFFWDAGLSYKPDNHFFLGINSGQLISNLPQAEGNIDLVRYAGGIDTGGIGFLFSGAYFQHEFLNAAFGKPRFYNDGGAGFFIKTTVAVHLGAFDINPFFLYGRGNWGEGSFYWFFGKLDIPGLYGYGVSAVYDERHLLNLGYLGVNLDVLGNGGEGIFDVGFDCFTGSYTLKTGGKKFSLEGTLGWLYGRGTLDGALTMSNQHYALFPFNFFNLTSSLNLHLGYGLVRFLYRPSVFQLNLSLGAANIFLGNMDIAVHQRMKNLFGGAESRETIGPLDLAPLGAAFLLLDLGVQPAMGRGRKKPLLFGIQKAFIIPWGYENLVKTGTGASGAPPPSFEGGLDAHTWRTILLSGLSLYLKLSCLP